MHLNITHADTHSHSISSSIGSSSVAVCLDESVSIENHKWITALAPPATSNRNQDFLLTKEKCSVCVCFVESIYYSFVIIVFFIILTLIMSHIYSVAQYKRHPSNEDKIISSNAPSPIDDYINFDFDKY